MSARDEQAALQMSSNLKEHLENLEADNEMKYLNNLAYTLSQRRSRFPWLAAHPARSLSDLIRSLDSDKMKPSKASERPKIGFVFTGQGAQWWAMGRELIDAYPVYRDCVLEAEQYLREFGCKWSLIGTEHFSRVLSPTNNEQMN